MLAAVGYALLPLQSWDYWWHITMGRLTAQTGAIPTEALYLYTMEADAPSFVQPWLAQWLLFQIHDLLGLRANLLVRNLVIAGSFGAVGWMAGRRAGAPRYGGLLGTAGLLFGFSFLDVRTNLFALPLFVGLVGLVYAIRSGRRSVRWLAAFPLVAALWANLHGSFLLPAVLCGLAAAAEAVDGWREGAVDRQRLGAWAGAAVASALAPLCNPRGVELYGYVRSVATDEVVQKTVTEWFPTTLTFPTMAGPLFWLVVAAGLALMVIHRRRVDGFDAVAFVAFGALAATQARGLIWFGLVMPMTWAAYLADAEADEEEEMSAATGLRWGRIVAGLLVAGALLVQPIWPWWTGLVKAYRSVPVRQEAPYEGAVLEETPVDLLEPLRRRGTTRLFHDESHAGFLLFHLTEETPRRMVFVDQRVELPGTDIWEKYFRASRATGWRPLFDRYGVDVVLVSRSTQEPLAERLSAVGDWHRVAGDGHNILFVRRAQAAARR